MIAVQVAGVLLAGIVAILALTGMGYSLQREWRRYRDSAPLDLAPYRFTGADHRADDQEDPA